MSSTANNNDLSVHSRFKEMNLTVGMDSNNLVLPWLEKHNNVFYGFAGGQWLSKDKITDAYLHKIIDHFTKDHLCDVYVSTNVDFKSFYETSAVKKWSSCSATSKSKTLLKVAKTIEKYQQLFVAVESVSSGKHPSKVKTKDIPDLIENFYYYACCALELQDKSKCEVWFPSGPVCVITEEYNNPSLSLSLRVASLLAAGNSIVVAADVKSCLSACLLAEICVEAGVPADVFNVVPINLESSPTGLEFIQQEYTIFSKVLYTGSVDKGVLIKAKIPVPFDVLVTRRPVVIIYENADLYSAAEGVLEAFFHHNSRCQSGGCKLMLQQSIAESFLKILEEMFATIEVGANLCKADMSCIVTEDQKKELEECLKEAEKHAKIYRKSNIGNLDYTYMQPTLITDVQPGFKLVHKELGGPIVVAVTFRTVKESLAMFNHDNKGSPVSIWSDKISVALEVSDELKSGTVWVNSQNIVSVSSAFSGVYLSGNSVVGGKDEFFSHLAITSLELCSKKMEPMFQMSELSLQTIVGNRKEYKLYIDGAYKQSENGKKLIRTNEIIYIGSRADVQSAVSSALAAQPKWENKSKHQRRQILLSIAGNLVKKKREFIEEMNYSCEDECEKDISSALNMLYYWACHIDSYNCETQEIRKNVKVLQYRNALGVIGITYCNDEPFLSCVSLLAPAIAFGNAVVAVVSDSLLVLKMCEIFDLSGVPGGVINVICGPADLAHDLVKNTDVNAIWTTGDSDICKSCHFTQRMFRANGVWKDFNEAKSLKCVMESTFIKTIFLPCGEIFAN